VISRTTKSFWKLFESLPRQVQIQAKQAYEKWRTDPGHSSLRFKCVNQRESIFSIRIGLQWRALGYRDSRAGQDVITWFWIGSHADYDHLIAGL
jgi:hypothetical protein